MSEASPTNQDRPTLIDVDAAKPGLPRTIDPMRPRLAAGPFNSADWLFELKWDGIRAVALASADGGTRVVDRHGGDLLPLVPELRDIKLPPGTALDGEIVVCDRRGVPNYELLAARAGPKALRRGRGPYFVAFDLLYENHRSLMARPLTLRRERLARGAFAGRRVLVPEHLESDGEPFLEVVAEYGLEGIVAKRRDSPYLPGQRTTDWLKCHVTPRSDVVLGGLLIDERRGAQSALCGVVNEDGSLRLVGEAAVPHFLGRWLDEATRAFQAENSPFAGPIALRTGLRWLQPRLVAIVEHSSADPLALGDARFKALRFDARAEDCQPEVAVPVPFAPPLGQGERPRLVLLQSLPFS